VGEMAMKAHALLFTALIGIGFFLLTGCTPQEKPLPGQPNANPTSTIPSSVPETFKIQTEICGKISPEAIATITGVKVDPPAVTTIDSVTGTKRHICSYSKTGEPAANVVKVTVVFKNDTNTELFQQLWANQQQAQQSDMKSISGAGTEAFIGRTNNQPILYMLAPTAQYSIQLGVTSESAVKQEQTIEMIAKSISS